MLYGGIDIGADEMGDASLDPAAAGNVGVSAGGPPEKVLRVSGRPGGRARRVRVGVGKRFRVSMLEPSTNTGLARFVVYGLLRVARYDDVLALPGGLGAMVFPPCILLPSMQTELFTLTNNFPLGPCEQLISSTPAPWTSSDIRVPMPVSFTVQGLIEETPGVIRTTNAVIVEVR